MTGDALERRIVRHIRTAGPIPVAAFMTIALHDPEAGYYARHDPIGQAGDFITAPEISQIFGELIGLWCAKMWQRIGRPDPVVLGELGPGRGTLARDLLRAAATLPDFRRALRLYLVEASPRLRAAQRQLLAAAEPVWMSRTEDLPAGPLLLVANEFLDALPVRQLVRGRIHWCERLVALDTEDGLVFAAGPENPALDLIVPEPLRRSAPTGAIVEICPPALALAAALGRRLAAEPGAALFVDYGYFPSAPGSTLCGVHRHRSTSPLATPGSADLSAHVDFAAFAAAARGAGAAVFGPVPQRQFLAALGISERLAALRARATAAQRDDLENGVRRLLAPGEMGTLFKAVALASPGMPPPPGFDAAPPKSKAQE